VAVARPGGGGADVAPSYHGSIQLRQVRTIRYREIADDLRGAASRRASSRRPAAAQRGRAVGRRYDASRVTVRRALEVLRDEGLLDARQGFGWFVATRPLRQSLARLATIEGQLARAGAAARAPHPRLRLRERVRPRARGARHDQVLQVRRLNLADGEPFARVTVWCPADLGQPPQPGRRGALAVLRAARRAARRRHPDHRRGRGLRRRRRAAADPGRARRCCAASG
jgi:DNA-binding transcriptional ArsR family regulator